MSIPKNLSAFIGKGEDYFWHPVAPMPDKLQTPAPAKPEPQIVQTPPVAPVPATPWKPGQIWNLELMNTDHREWARQFHDVCQASPEWHEAQAKQAAEQAERRRKSEEKQARRAQRRKAA